jgi:lysophospholipase L1-like esterase
MLIEKYEKNGTLFDLARYESTYADGSRFSFTKDNQKYFALIPEYAEDLGHLNELGRKIIAKQLLVYLALLNKK